MPALVHKVVSGGQTGVDRAALDVALELGLPCGGWCPSGRRAEDGPLHDRYPLDETPSPDYPQRTEWNVRDTDGTLVLSRGVPRGGTAFTLTAASRLGKPALRVDLRGEPDPRAVHRWIAEHGIRVLNVAGPREKDNPGIYEEAARLLRAILAGGAEPATEPPGGAGAPPRPRRGRADRRAR